MQAQNSRNEAGDSAILHDVNQDHEMVLWEALVVTQTQAKKKEYQLGLKQYSMHKKNAISTSNRSSTR